MAEAGDGPVFGQRVAGVSYLPRPSVYAIIGNAAGQVAVVRTPQGIYLPGGGIEGSETAEQALRREVLEECGLGIRVLAHLASATELVHSAVEATHFEKVSTFFTAVVEEHGAVPLDGEHETLWIAVNAAESLLSHASHRWAVRRAS